MRVGDRVRHRWLDDGVHGSITEYPAVDPDGITHSDQAAVQWDDGGFEIAAVTELREVHPN
ncbi:hypothetical protein ABQF26_03200 [Mycolicibacterium elephantis]